MPSIPPPALPRHPKAGDARLLYRYAAEGIIVTFEDNIYQAEWVNPALLTSAVNFTITHATYNGERIEIAIEEYKVTNLEKLIAENKWRPIEEAPKDGVVFLALPDSGMICRAKWSKFRPTYSDFYETDWRDHVVNIDTEYLTGISATHFRPLPDDRLAKCADVMMGVIWKVIDNVPLTLQEAQEYLDEALTECEKIARGV